MLFLLARAPTIWRIPEGLIMSSGPLRFLGSLNIALFTGLVLVLSTPVTYLAAHADTLGCCRCGTSGAGFCCGNQGEPNGCSCTGNCNSDSDCPACP